MWAAERGHVTIIEALLEKAEDMNECNNSGETVLALAARSNEIDLVLMLLAKGADVNQGKCSLRGTTPLMYAAQKGNMSIVQLLLEKGADVKLPNAEGGTALIFAA